MLCSARRSAIVVNSGVRIFELAPCPNTSKYVAPSGRISKAETSPFDGVAKNLNSSEPYFIVPSDKLFVCHRRACRSGKMDHLGSFESHFSAPAVEIGTGKIESLAELDQHI